MLITKTFFEPKERIQEYLNFKKYWKCAYNGQTKTGNPVWID